MALQKLTHFIDDLAQLVDANYPEAELLERAGARLGELVAVDDWLPAAYAQPSPERYQQFLLYADARQRFSVVSFVWGPGQSTPVHNHTVWGLIGVLRGAEIARPYRYDGHGQLVEDGADELLEAGDVSAVSPSIGDIHSVRNAYPDRTSISIHVYGANIGAVTRSVFPVDAPPKTFISGYANDTLPNLWNPTQESLPS